MRHKTFGFLIGVGVILMALFGCSADSEQYSPEEVINNALKNSKAPDTFYGEAESITKENGEVVDESILKEWRTGDGKVKLETENKEGEDVSIVVNDGKAITVYMVEENEAMIMDDPELLELNQPTPKEQADMMLEMMRDSHEISVEGEEEIAGRDTYHIRAEPGEENTLFGELDLWVDKETWMVLKTSLITNDIEMEIVYTKVDYDTEITQDLFELDLPEDVKIEAMDDMTDMEEEISLKEIERYLGKEVLYYPENEQIEISEIEKVDLTGELDRVEININYEKGDLPLLTLSVFETPEDSAEEDITLPGEEPIEIRDQDGSYIDSDELRFVSWQENGLSYSIILIDPNLTIEEFMEMADQMETIE